MRTWGRTWMAGLTGAALISVIAAIPTLMAEGQAMMMHGGHDHAEVDDHGGHYFTHLLKHAKEIGLSPEQVSRLKSLQLDFKRTEVRLEADTKVAEFELQALVNDEQADLVAIQAKVEQLKEAEGARLFAWIKAKRQAVALLNPDQREKERAVHEHMQSSRQHGGGTGMMGGSGHGQGSGGHGGGGTSGEQQHQH